MPFSYNLNSYSQQTQEQWLTLLNKNELLEDYLQDYFIRKGIALHYPLNPFVGYLQLATGMFFNETTDYMMGYPGDLLQALSCGINQREILATSLNRNLNSGPRNIFSPVHFYNVEKHLMPVSGVNGYHTNTATGLGRSLKFYGSDGIAACYLTYENLNDGSVYEAIRACDFEQLPVVFLVNGYMPEARTDISDLFGKLDNTYVSYCDNTNLFDTVNAVRKAFWLTREEKKPVLLIARGACSSKDLLESYTDLLEKSQKFTPSEINAFSKAQHQELQQDIKFTEGLEVVAPQQLIRQSVRVHEAEERSPEPETKTITLRKAITETLSEQMKEHRHSFLLSSTTGDAVIPQALKQDLGPRLFPLHASASLLAGSGGAMCHYNANIRVVVSPQGGGSSFYTLAATLVDQVFLAWKSGLQQNMLLLLPVYGFDGSGPFNSHKLDNILLSIPGIRVFYPAFADDASGMIRTAFKSPGITVLLESRALYDDKLASRAVHPQHETMTGKARVVRAGTDLTIVAWGNATHLALKAADKLVTEYNQQAEVLDLRSLLPLDKVAILKSIKKTGRAMVVNDGYLFANTAADIAAMASREAFTDLRAPIGRVGALFSPVPYQKDAEAMALPSVNRIIDEALDILEY